MEEFICAIFDFPERKIIGHSFLFLIFFIWVLFYFRKRKGHANLSIFRKLKRFLFFRSSFFSFFDVVFFYLFFFFFLFRNWTELTCSCLTRNKKEGFFISLVLLFVQALDRGSNNKRKNFKRIWHELSISEMGQDKRISFETNEERYKKAAPSQKKKKKEKTFKKFILILFDVEGFDNKIVLWNFDKIIFQTAGQEKKLFLASS